MGPPHDPARAWPGPAPEAGAEAGAQPLTERQAQILDRLRKGYSNKDIARDLGIGVGTVKQHINLLFKKLDVRNRTMAVSHGAPPRAAPAASPGPDAAPAGRVERRPVSVLSLVWHAEPDGDAAAPGLADVSETGAAEAGAEERAADPLHATLARIASDFGAVALPRGDGGDLVFGLPRAREQDPLRALRAAFASVRAPALRSRTTALSAALDSGEVTIGVDAAGLWDGEIRERALLRRVRAAAAATAPGSLTPGAGTRALAARLCGDPEPLPGRLDLARPPTLSYRVPAPMGGLRGREREQALLAQAVADLDRGQGTVLVVEGEAGIGKTALLAALAPLCRARGRTLETWRCLPPDGQPAVPARGWAMRDGDATLCEAAWLAGRLSGRDGEAPSLPEVLVLDDLHWLPAETRLPLAEAMQQAAEQGRLVVAARRPGASDAGPEAATRPLRLGRLPRHAVAAICGEVATAPLRAEARAALCDRALGVPLFAVALARALDSRGAPPAAPPPVVLSLLVARLDGLGLDRRLLRLFAGARGARRLESLRRDWPAEAGPEAALAAAERAGLLRRRDTDTGPAWALRHPMIQAVLDHVMSA